MDRRNFLKTVGVAGLATSLPSARAEESNESKIELSQLPGQVLGKTGVVVPRLALGVEFNAVENQIVLRKALEWGINYWDTGDWYANGLAEEGIGKFFKNNPAMREKIFLVTKPDSRTVASQVEEHLQASLKKMNTDYIDWYCGVHACHDPRKQLTDELRKWAESAKRRGLIKYFGFSTHKNMAKTLSAAAKLDWIDAIITTYNFRVMADAEIDRAVEACHKAGIGLTAMKTLGHQLKEQTKEDKKVIEHFIKGGYTAEQAKIKTVLEDKRFSAACVGMQSVALLTTNIAAVLDKKELSAKNKQVLAEYAQATCDGYCAGCSDICDNALPDMCISSIMRYLMYYNSYGDKEKARNLFAQIPADVRGRLLSMDYKAAEKYCPQGLAISKLMAEAVSKLA